MLRKSLGTIYIVYGKVQVFAWVIKFNGLFRQGNSTSVCESYTNTYLIHWPEIKLQYCNNNPTSS